MHEERARDQRVDESVPHVVASLSTHECLLPSAAGATGPTPHTSRALTEPVAAPSEHGRGRGLARGLRPAPPHPARGRFEQLDGVGVQLQAQRAQRACGSRGVAAVFGL